MKTKILGLLATTFVILAFSGCDFFNSKEGQTSVINGINFPEGTVESVKIYTKFPAGSSGQLITITHKDNNGEADDLNISYRVTDSNGDNKYDGYDCMGLALRVQGGDVETLYTGVSQLTDGGNQKIWIEADGTGECHNTPFSLHDWNTGGNLALALSDQSPDVIPYIGNPGFIEYGTKKSTTPISQWNITGIEAEVEIRSTYGKCSNGQVWNETTKVCETQSTGGGGNSNWAQHTWQFSDGSETSYILTRTDSEYLNYIAGIEAQCAGIPKSKFQWKANAGNDSYWKEFGIPECGGGGGTPATPPPGQPSCYTESNESEKCEICEDASGNEMSRECWALDDGGENPWENEIVDKNELERQKRDMQNQLKDHKRNNLKELERIAKELERVQKDIEKRIERYQKLLKRTGSDGAAASTLNDTLQWQNERLTQIAETVTDARSIKTTCEANIAKAEGVVNALVSGTTKRKALDEAWQTMRKYTEPCWMLRSGVEFPLRVAEQENELGDILFELSKAMDEMDNYGIDVPGFITEFLSNLDNLIDPWMPKALECKNEIKQLGEAVFAATTREDVDSAIQGLRDEEQDCNWDRQDMQYAFDDWRSTEPWKITEQAWRVMDDQRYKEQDKGELENIKAALIEMADLSNQVKTDDEFVKKALANIERLRLEALPIVEKMLEAASLGQEVDWQKLDQMGGVFDQSAKAIRDFCSREPQNCSLSQAVNDLIYESDRHDEGPGRYIDDFSRFEDELVKRIDQIMGEFEKRLNKSLEDVVKNFERLFNERTAGLIMDFSERQDGIADSIENIFNNADYLGDDKMKSATENSTALYEVIRKFDDYNLKEDHPDIWKVVDEWKQPVNMPASSLKDEIIAKFEALLSAINENNDTSALVAELEAKFEENRKKLAVEDNVQHIDAPLTEWYGGSLIGWEGDRDLSGNRTGYVRPADPINRCEVLKRAIESSGMEKSPGISDWWCSTYIETARDNGFAMAVGAKDNGHYSGNPTRAEIAQLWIDAGDLKMVGYNGGFPDVKYTDPFADIVATVNEYGIMTGQGNGKFDPWAPTNRAEVAAMEGRFEEAIAPEQFLDSLSDINLDSLETGDNTGIFE